MLTITDPSKVVWADMPLNEMALGNAMDALFTLEIFEILEQELKKNGTYNLYKHIISPSLSIFAEMENRGFLVDQEALTNLESVLDSRRVSYKNIVYENSKIKKEDNIASNADLVDILYLRDDGYNLYPPIKTKKSAPSVNAKCIEILIRQIEDELAKREKNVEKQKG